jgi:Rad3-related DNA helicase
MDYCTCGIIEMDENDNPILFYNKKNQIFLLEQGAQVFQPSQDLKNDVKNLNLTNSIMRKCKTLGREQRKRYIELGKYCEECQVKDDIKDDIKDETDDIDVNKVIESNNDSDSDSGK